MDLIWINLQVIVDHNTGCSAQETGWIVSSVRAVWISVRTPHRKKSTSMHTAVMRYFLTNLKHQITVLDKNIFSLYSSYETIL